jgi:phage gp36-like protein
MSAYALQADMVARFGEQELIQLTDRENREAIVSEVLERALDDAEAEINSYLSTRYQLPFLDPPAVLKRLACDIARYCLYDERATETVTQRYEAAVKMLRAFADGKATLGLLSTQQEPSPTVSTGPEYFSQAPVFTRESLGDYL